MRIMVIGAGKVGYELAENLSRENHDVVVIDTDQNAIQRCEDTLDVMTVNGNGANARTLVDAAVDRTDIFISATASDETNMLSALIAKRLGADYTIARIRDPEYNDSQMLLQRELGIDLAINPERATALEISRLLRYPFASNIETFANGQVELVEFRAQEKDVICGIPLRDLPNRLSGIPHVLYAVVQRNGEITVPTGDFVIQPGDRVYVAGEVMRITSYFRYLDRQELRVRNIMLLGGGRISYYLAKILTAMNIHVTMIEINSEKARELSDLFPKADIICGDGTSQELLEEQGLRGMEAFIALTDRDEENLMTGLYASDCGVPKVIVKSNRIAYSGIMNRFGLDSILSPKSITSSMILRYVRSRVNSTGTKVERLYRLMDGRAEALEFIARKEDPYIGIPLRDLKTREGALIAVIVRQDKVIVPFGNDRIEAGDHVVVITRDSGTNDLNEVISK